MPFQKEKVYEKENSKHEDKRMNELDEAFPAFLVILTMPLTSSIATGISLGFIAYPIVKAAKGKWREIHPLVFVFAAAFTIG